LDIYQHGFEIHTDVIPLSIVEQIKQELEAVTELLPHHGIRHADKKFSTIKKLARSKCLLDKAQQVLGGKLQTVRVIFFDKVPGKNGLVTWHQDKTIAVNHKIDVPGWRNWSLKEGVHHVQPGLG
jgi:hypothetical protein